MPAQHDFEVEFFENILTKHPDYTEALEFLAHYYTKAGRIKEGLSYDWRVVALKPTCPTSFYNLACSLCLHGESQAALEALQKAIALGYSDFKWMRKDPDLKALQGLPEFRAWVR